MSLSVFSLFKISLGPSSSHTLGPMLACGRFVAELRQKKLLPTIAEIRVDLYGSLALTGMGHGIDKALYLGLEGETPETLDLTQLAERLENFKNNKKLRLGGELLLSFDPRTQLKFHRQTFLPRHPNGMSLHAFNHQGKQCLSTTYYSIGGGAVLEGDQPLAMSSVNEREKLPYPFETGKELLALCAHHNLTIWQLMLANEKTRLDEISVMNKLDGLWAEMSSSIDRGCHAAGVLPGKLNLVRRAPDLFRKLTASDAQEKYRNDPLQVLDWVNMYAMAVNEENAAGARIVTAPTNGAAGVIPATLRYYVDLSGRYRGEGVREFLLTAGAVGFLYVHNASISGAQVGCQGEVGVACSMAAAGLAAALGASVLQVEQAAEIAMEHNLGLTCDPIGGLVQIPCIERNAMGAVKAINAAKLALKGEGKHVVSLDSVIATMKQTGEDMKSKYKETSRGGLAVNVVEC